MLRASIIVVLLALLPSYARAEPRIALLIGNQDYSDKVGALKNPHNDVDLIEAALKKTRLQGHRAQGRGLSRHGQHHQGIHRNGAEGGARHDQLLLLTSATAAW